MMKNLTKAVAEKSVKKYFEDLIKEVEAQALTGEFGDEYFEVNEFYSEAEKAVKRLKEIYKNYLTGHNIKTTQFNDIRINLIEKHNAGFSQPEFREANPEEYAKYCHPTVTTYAQPVRVKK